MADRKDRKILFAISRIWREPQFHGENGCNFCSVTLGSRNSKPYYLSLECSIAPAPHNYSELPVARTKINQKMVNHPLTPTVVFPVMNDK